MEASGTETRILNLKACYRQCKNPTYTRRMTQDETLGQKRERERKRGGGSVLIRLELRQVGARPSINQITSSWLDKDEAHTSSEVSGRGERREAVNGCYSECFRHMSIVDILSKSLHKCRF